jgi:hypothetical protein
MFYVPYTILNHMGPMAYELSLPIHSKLYLVFHVFFLNKVIGGKCKTQTSLSELN